MSLTERRLRMPLAMGLAMFSIACGQDSKPALPPESGGSAASPKPVPTIEVQPTPTPLIEVTPTLEPTPPTELKPERTFDGLYIGTTSQGADFEFKAEQNNISAWGVGFNIPGCVTDNMVIEYNEAKAKELPIKQNSFSFTELNALQGIRANIQGTFDPDSNAWKGNADIDCKGSKLRVAWTASFVESPPPPQIPPEVLARIPDLKIPQGLFIPGKELINPFGFSVIAERGDWFLVTVGDSLYPVPKGWLIVTNFGEEDGILVFAKGGIEVEDPYPMRLNKEAEIEILIGGRASSRHDTIEQAIATIEEQLKSQPKFSVVRKTIVDPKRGYILLEGTLSSGIKRYQLFFFSEFYAKGPGTEIVRTVNVTADGQQAWFDYYPVIRAIIANWASTRDNSTVGVALPERLP